MSKQLQAETHAGAIEVALTVGAASPGPVIQPRRVDPHAYVPPRPDCDNTARVVEVTRYSPLVGVSVTMTCTCRSTHWAYSPRHGGYRTAEEVPLDVVARQIRREGYELAGTWTAHLVPGEWEHVAHRAPVRRLPEPVRPESQPAPQIGPGERIEDMNPGRCQEWWRFTNADGFAYEVSHRAGCNPRPWLALDDRQQRVTTADTGEALLHAVREHAAERAQREAGTRLVQRIRALASQQAPTATH